MRTLEFDVKGQELSKHDEKQFFSLVKGAKTVLCKFMFDDTWKDYKKAIEFITRYESQFYFLDEDDCFEIPETVLANSYFRVKLYAIKDDEVVFPTNTILIRQMGDY